MIKKPLSSQRIKAMNSGEKNLIGTVGNKGLLANRGPAGDEAFFYWLGELETGLSIRLDRKWLI